MTNREEFVRNEEFQRACEAAGIKPNVRQFVKWKSRRGAAYLAANGTTRAELNGTRLTSVANKT